MVPVLPLLFMASFRFQPLGVTVLLLVLALFQLWIPFPMDAWGAERTKWLGLPTVQRLVIFGDFITMVVLVASQERRLLVAGLEAQALRLERLVEERTRELVAANARLERLSQRDALTGIANRRRFEQVLQREWARAREGGIRSPWWSSMWITSRPTTTITATRPEIGCCGGWPAASPLASALRSVIASPATAVRNLCWCSVAWRTMRRTSWPRASAAP